MARKRVKPRDVRTVIFHSPSGCYEFDPSCHRQAIIVAMRHRNAIALVASEGLVAWQAPHSSVFLIDQYSHDTAMPSSVRVPSLCDGKWRLASRYFDKIRDRYEYDPRLGWMCKHHCWACGVGLPSGDDEVLCFGGFRLCRPCDSGIKRQRIRVDRSDLNRKWNRYLKAIDSLAVSH